MTTTLVAAVAANGVIGADGGLPWRLPGELAHFKQLTMGQVLVMGRRTFESIGRVLPGRTTVVVTRQGGWSHEGVRTAGDVGSALALGATLGDEVFVVGGAEVFAAAMPYADRMVLSWVHQSPEGDTWFPAVDWSDWRDVARTPGKAFDVVAYDRVRPSGSWGRNSGSMGSVSSPQPAHDPADRADQAGLVDRA